MGVTFLVTSFLVTFLLFDTFLLFRDPGPSYVCHVKLDTRSAIMARRSDNRKRPASGANFSL